MKTFAEKIIDSMVDENGHCGERGLSPKQFEILFKHLSEGETRYVGGAYNRRFTSTDFTGTIGRYNVKLNEYYHFNPRYTVVSIDKWIDELPDFENSEFVGEIKSRIERVVTFIGNSSYEREAYTYGWETVYIYKFADEDGNMLVWKTTSSLGYWDETDNWKIVRPGESIKLRGTVKQHSVYNGVKQTVLNRCIVKF